jgi:hypothetical protein
MSKKLTSKQFVTKSRKIHGNKYDYSQTIYGKNNLEKVIISCPIHGPFKQRPSYHLTRRGCPKCGLDICKNSRRNNINEFIRKSKKIHGNKYDYSLSKYINVSTKVKIMCPIHGEFYQTPSAHYILKQGCPKCGIEKQKLSTTFDLKEFIEKCKIIHGDVYDYSKVKYVNCHTKILIGCKRHGYFYQLPLNHLKRNGCPQCQSSYGESEIFKTLKNFNTPFITEKTFGECKNPKTNRLLPFDFWIPSKNLLIEYDGKHHFQIGKFGKYKSNLKALKATKFRDKIKNQFAKKRGFLLIRIKYTKLKQIKEILEKVLL